MKNNCIIPDAELAEYLSDKLLVKPDYPSEVEPVEVKSKYQETLKRMKRDRAASNKVFCVFFGGLLILSQDEGGPLGGGK